jgi:glycosyltransferase involved in cell wall biosynthesis
MTKPVDGSRVLFFTPEALYPTLGGGALRSASLFEYLEAHYQVDAITFREDFAPVAIPGARDLLILDLPHHSKHKLARAARNLRRFIVGRPPLLDRYSGFQRQIGNWLHGREYDIVIVEHFWVAPYADVLRPHTRRLVLDLHNIESVLQSTAAAAAGWPMKVIFRRFQSAYQRLEREWLPHFDDVLVTSGADASRVPADRVTVYPNAIPRRDAPDVPRDHAIVFTGNLEYDPNVSAVRWFAHEVWPVIRHEEPALEWRLVGRNAHAIEPYLRGVEGVQLIGEVADAVVEIARAKVAVVPLLAGSGTRFKIIEAWAAATPVVSTSIGAEGLGAADGIHLAIADGPVDFAKAVLRTIRSPGSLGRSGRQLYLERYTTETGWKLLAELGI